MFPWFPQHRHPLSSATAGGVETGLTVASYLRQIPNVLTILRIVLVVPFAVCMARHQFGVALVILFAAGLTDGLDGFLARYFRWRTLFGSIADPVADKVLLVTAYVSLGFVGHMHWWLVAVVVGRDLLIFTGAITYWFAVGKYEGKPTLVSKACTFFQILVGIGVLANLVFLPLPPWFFQVYPGVLLVLCVVSLLQYMQMGWLGYRQRESTRD